MDNIFVVLAVIFMIIYNVGFLKNLDKRYFKKLSYILPFSFGIILFNVFFLGFVYDEFFSEVYYTLMFLPFLGIGLTLYMHGFKKLLLLHKDDKSVMINDSSIKNIEKWLNYLYICDIAAVIIFIIIFL